MNKRMFGAICAAVFSLPLALPAANMVVEKGKPVAEIVLPVEKTHVQLTYAAEELALWTGRITGAKLPILAAPAGAKTKIVLGTPSHSAAIRKIADPDALKKIGDSDGFVIRESGDTIYIYAACTKGVLNGVYRFLEKNTDIIWVRERDAETGCGTIYSKVSDLKNTVENLVDVPVLTGARFWTNHSPGNSVWQARLLNCFTRPLDGNMFPDRYQFFKKVGRMDEIGGTLGLGLLLKYKDTHPEYFPLVRGKRVTYHDCQLCFMNPATIKAFCEEAEKLVAGQPKKVTNYNLGLGDNWDVCECELCMAPIKLPDGTVVKPEDANFRSTQYALFSNAVSDHLTKKFPHVKPIAAAAYLFTAVAPAVKVKGGGPMYCPYIKNHKKPVYDDSVNKVWHDKAESFRKTGNPVRGLYEYYLCHTTPQFYHAISEVAQKDLQYYLPELQTAYLDVVYGDNDGHDPGGVYDVSAIEFWVYSRLMWDPSIDVKETRREFCRRAYREAADVMIRYYEKLGEVYNNDSAGCFWNDNPISAAKHYIVDKKLAKFVRETLKEAENAAVHPGSKELIQRHAARMERLIAEAEKLPPIETLQVPLLSGVPAALDPDHADWKDAAVIPEFKVVRQADVPAEKKTRVRIRHNRESLYLLFEFESPRIVENIKAMNALPDKGMTAGTFDWCNCVEMFVDGGLRAAGSYYHLCFMYNGRTYSGQGPTLLDDPPEWTAKVKPTAKGAVVLVTIPLSEIGVNISQGNKIGAMFVGNEGAWNGGQWHSPTGFQILQLNMD